MNKIKIFNDPVHGIIRFKHEILYDLIDHPYFQSLRRIKQMGLSSLVYPGANHTRFEHALGALHLMTKALDTLRDKNVEISEEEYVASCIAILCHDLGHGPFSHALENELVPESHEEISLILLQELKHEFGGPIELAIKIFTNKYERMFLCQLVSSQLDMDRLDYLSRDSFFSGVVEGKVGYDRIIMMLNVVGDELVIEEKGISSVERFLLSRHMMYSQVYLHKTALSAEQMLKVFVKRCVNCFEENIKISWNENLFKVVEQTHLNSYNAYNTIIHHFTELDDCDVMEMLKINVNSCDFLIKLLSQGLLRRKLFKVYLHRENLILDIKRRFEKEEKIEKTVINELIFAFESKINIYSVKKQPIKVLMKTGELIEFSKVSTVLPRVKSKKEKLILAPKEV